MPTKISEQMTRGRKDLLWFQISEDSVPGCLALCPGKNINYWEYVGSKSFTSHPTGKPGGGSRVKMRPSKVTPLHVSIGLT